MTSRALIIGGTHGLGYELARLALQQGVEPIVTGRNPSAAITIDDTSVRAEPMDVTDDTSVVTCIDRFKVQPSLGFRYLFYLPGVPLQGKLCQQPWEDIIRTIEVSQLGWLRVVRAFHPMKKRPYHLVTIASTTSWRVRKDETVYGGAKAAEAMLARDFHDELVTDLPGSRNLIVHACGMNTPFWHGSGIDASIFPTPDKVAALIWQEITLQESGDQPPLHELSMARDPDGTIAVTRGPQAPR